MDEDEDIWHATPKENPLLYYEKDMTLKKYASCERATKGLTRCINMKHYKMKIGKECVSFCQSHIVEAISKMLFLIMKEKWFVDYWDPIMNRWDTEQLIFSNEDEFVIYFYSLQSVQESRMYTLVAFLESDENESDENESDYDESDEKRNENIRIDFDEPFCGTARKELLRFHPSEKKYSENQDTIQSTNLQNIVFHFLKYHELQPFTLEFMASLRTLTSEDIEKRFIILDEDQDPQINIQFAPHLNCGNIKIPANIEMDSIEEEDGPTDYFIMIRILVDFSS
jgi:hypothetical protein